MKIKPRLIGMDLDGTLLTSDKRLTEHTKEVLKKAADQGVIVMPVTGRPLGGIPKDLSALPYVRYAITANGGRTVDLKKGISLFEQLLSVPVAGRILEIFERYDTLREIYYDGMGYAQEDALRRIGEYLDSPPMAEYILSTRTPVRSIRELFEQKNQSIDKLQALFITMEEKEEVLAELKAFPEIEVTGALLKNIEVNAKGVNKGDAILTLGRKLGIRREEILAFGDGSNDIQLMQKAGISVAMENGIEEVRQAADYIAASNDEDGVARFIEEYVLN